MKKFVIFLFSVALPVGIGYLSSFFTKNSTEFYTSLRLPVFAPPAWVFPVVWTILYILMGISFYLIVTSKENDKAHAYFLYFLQLSFNFVWSILFFTLNLLFASFVWIVVLAIIVYRMVLAFYDINNFSGVLQIPYLFWLLFAGYLNLGIIILN